MKILGLNLDSKYVVEITKYYQSQIELKTFVDVASVREVLKSKEEHTDVLLVDITECQDQKFALIAEAKRMEIAVIVLSTNYELSQRERYILLGANVVIKMPCSTVEIIHTALAVSSCYSSSKLVDSNFTVDLVRRKIWYKEKELILSSQVFELVVFFIRNTGKVMSREQLLESVSPCKSNLCSRNIDTLVKTIRKETCPTLIKTVRCSGYVYDNSGLLK